MKINSSFLYRSSLILVFGILVARFFTENFGLTYAINPIFDALELAVFILAFRLKKSRRFEAPKTINIAVLIIILVCIASIIIHFPKPIDLFYSIRPYFRLIVAFYIGIKVFDKKRLDQLINLLKYLIYVNVPIMLFQYFILNLKQDWIGGTFGNTPGCNQIQNLICCIVLTYTLLKFLEKRVKKNEFILVNVSCIIICALAEITMFFFEIIIIYGCAILMKNRKAGPISARKISLIILGLVAVFGGIYLYLRVFPERAFLLSFQNILEYLGANKSSTGVYRISRIRVFSQLSNMFFPNLSDSILGFGLGNCSTHSSFYSSYGELLNYDWVSSSIIFLETGYLGVASNIAFFVCIYHNSIKGNKKENLHRHFVQIMCLLCFVYFFATGILKNQYTAYLLGIILSSKIVIERDGVNI